MAKSTLVQMADDVTGLIEATIQAHSGTVTRVYIPQKKELQESALLIAEVVGTKEKRFPSDRAGWQRNYTVEIGVSSRVEADAETDDLTGMLETISNLLEVTELPSFRLRPMEIEVLGPDAETLHQYSSFLGWVRVTYRKMR